MACEERTLVRGAVAPNRGVPAGEARCEVEVDPTAEEVTETEATGADAGVPTLDAPPGIGVGIEVDRFVPP